MSTTDQQNRWIWILLILLLATGLRLFNLDRMSLWGDEACMVYLCQDSPLEIVDALASADRPDVDVAPPLYFLLLNGWMTVLGTSLLAFRGFSALFGVLTVFFIIKSAQSLFNRHIALLAGVLAAINPFQIWYSQEGRMYTMASCLAAAAIWCLALIMEKPQRRSAWFGFICSGLMLIYTQYYGALLLTAMVLFIFYRIWRDPQKRKTLATGIGVTIVTWTAAFSPWLPVLVTDYRHAGAPGGFPLMFNWLQTPAFLYLKAILFGNQQYVLDHLWLYPIPLLLSVGAVLLAVKQIKTYQIQLLLLSFGFPFCLVYSLSLLGMRVYKSHPFIIFHPALLILLAYGLTRFKPIWFKISTTLVVIAQIFVLSTLVLAGDYVKPRSADVADWIESQADTRARVMVIPAFIPNPMSIVGDLLAFKYHSGSRFYTSYLVGDSSADIVNRITDPRELIVTESSGDILAIETVFVVCQTNPQVQPYLDEIFSQLDKHWSQTQKKAFPSRSRGFSMMAVQYEVRPI